MEREPEGRRIPSRKDRRGSGEGKAWGPGPGEAGSGDTGRSPARGGGGSSHSGLIGAPPPPRRRRLRPLLRGPVSRGGGGAGNLRRRRGSRGPRRRPRVVGSSRAGSCRVEGVRAGRGCRRAGGVTSPRRRLRGPQARWARRPRRVAGEPGREARAGASAGKRGEVASVSTVQPSAPREGKTSSSAVQTGRRAEQRPTEAEAYFLNRPFPKAVQSPGSAARLRASDARLPPPLSHNPPSAGRRRTPRPPAAVSVRRCGRGRTPGRCSARAPACFRPRPLLNPAAVDALAPVGANGLARNKPRQRNEPELRTGSVPRPREYSAPGFPFPLAPFGNPFALLSLLIIVRLWLQGRALVRSRPGFHSSQG